MVDGVVASTVVWLAALPLVALRFHLVSPIGILLNIPLIPLTSAALLLGGLGLAFAAVWGPLGASSGLGRRLVAEVDQGDRALGGRAAVGTPLRGRARVGMGPGLLCLARSGRRRLRRILRGRLAIAPGWTGSEEAASGGCWRPGSSPAGCSRTSRHRPRTLEAEFLAVGHGLAVLIQTPDGQTLLYDCGRLGDPTVGRRIIAPALWARGVARIDTVFLSHADQDHYNGLTDLLDRFPIGTVRIPPGFGGPRPIQRPMQLARSNSGPAASRSSRSRRPQSWETAGVGFRGPAPPGRLAPGDLRQRPQHRARRRLRRPPPALDR